MPDAQVFIDGVELVPPALSSGTSALTGSVTRRLNLPSQATCNVPQHLAIGGVGSRMKVYIDDVLWHHGFVTVCETTADENTGYTVYNSEDPMELWRWRPCRDFLDPTPGNMINPNFPFRLSYGEMNGMPILGNSGPQMLLEVLFASENPALINTVNDDPVYGPVYGGSFAEGPLFLEFQDFESGGINLSGGFTTWPMSIAEMASLLVSTGQVDIVITPIDSGGNMGSISVYNGNYGRDLTGSVILEYGMGAHNIKALNWIEDMTNITNKLQYFFNRVDEEHYRTNITFDDPCMINSVGIYPLIGLQVRRNISRQKYGVRMDIQEFEVGDISKQHPTPQPDPLNPVCEYLDPKMEIFRQRWWWEQNIRIDPRRRFNVTPIGDFGINVVRPGDRITVRCTPVVRGGFSGIQRIYELTVSWDSSGVLQLSDLVTSPDQEGI